MEQSYTPAFERFEVLFDGCHEHPVDIDFTLPDYCPDIQKILKCRFSPQISTCSVVQDTLLCDGICVIHVLYLDNRGEAVRTCEARQQFSVQIKLKHGVNSSSVSLRARCDYVNCRAVSARRVDIHGAFSVVAYVAEKKTEPLLQNADGLELLQEPVTLSTAAAGCSSQFTVEDSLELPAGKPPVETLVRSTCSIRLKEAGVSNGKLMLKGAACLSMLYLSAADGTTLEHMETEIPFTRVEDCTGAGDEALCDVRLEVGEVTVSPKADGAGENTRLDIWIRMFLGATVYSEENINFITDAYSTACPVKLERAQGQFERGVNSFIERFSRKTRFEVPEHEIARVLDLWSEGGSVSALADDSGLHYRGRYTLCLLGVDLTGMPFYAEKICEFTEDSAKEKAAGRLRAAAELSAVTGLQYHIDAPDSLEVTTELQLHCRTAEIMPVTYVCSAEVDTASPYKENGNAVAVYFARAGEPLWEIARNHRASLARLREENDWYEDTIDEDRAFLIPV
ncbi:MAG: DUF3794 domain-containing protein [Clostridia bacterium]|nr:DUF3794 domain-containing protein [Clostridia bacterium]